MTTGPAQYSAFEGQNEDWSQRLERISQTLRNGPNSVLADEEWAVAKGKDTVSVCFFLARKAVQYVERVCGSGSDGQPRRHGPFTGLKDDSNDRTALKYINALEKYLADVEIASADNAFLFE
mmetsp:Transcript_6465/g.15854  ORF Transcript_6465/g.15854 Transcript_6465/m.15854 type:complete len:122 (-) Transcript_6465:31-396(-)